MEPEPTAVEVRSADFDRDLERLTGELRYRLDAIFPADAPSAALLSRNGVAVLLRSDTGAPPGRTDLDDLAGRPTVVVSELVPAAEPPEGRPSLVITRDDGSSGVGRAGMRYRDLLPDRWGGRFIASHITIPEGGPVPDSVHFHDVRFQMIFVKAGWVEVVYEGQGAPFVMHAGDCVLQPPTIRHRVLRSSPGLEVIEIGCPAEHLTAFDHELELPTAEASDPDRTWRGQRFVRHVAEGAPYERWRFDGWEFRDTGIAEATGGLAGARVARPTSAERGGARALAHDTEFAQLVVLSGAVILDVDGDVDGRTELLAERDAVAIPGGLPYRLVDATPDCELLDVTLPAETPAEIAVD